MLDPRIGQYHGEEPEVCAVSGQSVRGRPSSQYPLDKQHYYRVLAKVEGDFAWRASVEETLKAVIAAAGKLEAPARRAAAKEGES